MTVIVRFAPSPTGLIHIGNARTALLNALFARRAAGTFVLRFDDTDPVRSKRGYADATEVDLAWLGIEPDTVVRQSDRLALYRGVQDRLIASGRLYPCYETADELERRRRLQLTRGQPPVYDRAALKLTAADRAKLEEEGRTPHWRFRLEDRSVRWDDLVRGPSHAEAASLSDPVLVREDGSYLYTLPSVADDAALAVTHVIRGEDHVTNTAVQIQIFEALGAPVPAFGHHNLLTTTDGEGLSKRSGALSLQSLRAGGLEPMAVAALAVLVGSSESVRSVATLDELARLVDLSHISRAPARFDPAELDTLNARLLHETDYAAVQDRLKTLGVGGGEAFWLAVRGNIGRLDEAAAWWLVVSGPVDPVAADPSLSECAARLLPTGSWDESTWKTWTTAVREETGLKGKALFLPLRRTLTGLDYGPELAALLPLIGPERVRGRLEGRRV